MGSLVHDIIYVEKYTLEIAHEKIYTETIEDFDEKTVESDEDE